MNRIFGLLILVSIMFSGAKDILRSFENPEFIEMTIEELESLGTRGYEYLHITGGFTTGDYIHETSEYSQAISSTRYAVLSMSNLYLDKDSSRARAKFFVIDSDVESISYGTIDVKGKVKDIIFEDDEYFLFREDYVIDADYIILEKDWEKPRLWVGLLMFFIPGIMLYFRISSIFFH